MKNASGIPDLKMPIRKPPPPKHRSIDDSIEKAMFARPDVKLGPAARGEVLHAETCACVPAGKRETLNPNTGTHVQRPEREHPSKAGMQNWLDAAAAIEKQKVDDRGIPIKERLSDYMPHPERGRWRRILRAAAAGLIFVLLSRWRRLRLTIEWRLQQFWNRK